MISPIFEKSLRSKATTMAFAFVFLFFGGVLPAHAAIIEQAPVIDGFFENNPTIGGGAIMPLAKFRLSQASGTDTLTKVGVTLVASSTMANGSISRLSLWKESGTKPGFQLDSDTFIAGAASTTVTTGLLVVLQPTTGETISSSGTEFFIIASTTAVTGLTNGHGFNVQMDANYASTSASTGVGANQFLSNRKVSLNRNATLKISEVKIGTALSGADEFIELYNSGEADINLSDLPLNIHSFYANGSSTPGISLTYYKRIIPSHGYFLITNKFGYSGIAQADAVLATSTFSILLENGGLSIATSTLAASATSTAIDYVGWGTQPITSCENVEASTTPCVLSLLENGASIERLAQGYPNATSTVAGMQAGGADSTKGNGFDKNFNKTDFVAQTIANPQNSLSPIEFPFGGGQTDTSSFQVQGSYPTHGQTGVPIDTKFIGFNLTKSANADTIASTAATTTVTLFQVANNGPTGSNLCSSVLYTPESSTQQAKCNITSTLAASTSYVFTVTSAVRDLSGNSLDQDTHSPGNQYYAATSTTGSATTTATNVTPPSVSGTSPLNGSTNIPSNLVSMAVEFSTDMMPSTITGSTGSTTITLASSAGTAVAFQSFSFSTSTGKNVLSMVPGTLAANTTYILTITGGVQSTNGINLASPYSSRFTTGASGGDTTAPTIVGVLPTNATTIAANTNDFVIIFDDAMDASTATSGAITLAITSGPNLPGTVRYDPVAKEAHFVPSNILPVSTGLTLTLKGASLKNASGVYLGTNVTKTWTVEASNTDTTGPTVLYVNVDEFSVAVTFGEAVNSVDATNLSNYSLVVGGVTQTPSALAGHTITYDASTRTAKLSGLRLTSGASVTASVSNIKDISGNIQTATANSLATVNSSTGSGGTGGFVGPGSFTGSTFGTAVDFSSAGIGFMPPVNIRPTSTFINASSTYAFELPLAKRINASGTIVITLPSTSDFGLCCV
ncbi:MAG: Ig-like domain-containing protein, partial [Parcubacteria group bacterium]|nr:Ig-like domain-containing protein [Parcubacteria group bacterium]